MDRESIENVLSRQRAQKFGSMDQPNCQEAIKVKSRNLDKRNLCRAVVEMLSKRYQAAVEMVSSSYREDRSKVFQGRKNTQNECNKIATQTSIQAAY